MKKILFGTLFAASIILSLNSCTKHHNNNNPLSKTFVIVHGAWQAPYAWLTVKAQLEAAGQKVVLVELPGHGEDTTPPQNLSLDVYREKVISAINAKSGKVILVGHSMAGMVISEVAEKIPASIEKLVYIAAYLPATGQSLLDLANTDAASALATNLRPSKDMLTLDVVHDSIADAFVQDGSAAVKAEVVAKFMAEPAIPFTNKVTLTPANFGSVNLFYIHTLQDRIVTIDLQNRMVAAAGVKHIYSINSSHSPFLSMPEKVTAVLLAIAKQ